MLRAISAGEVDAFVVARGDADRRVFVLATADRPYRSFVENMRDGAATLSESGLILYANPRLAELLSCSRETIIGSPLTRFLAAAEPVELRRSADGAGTAVELSLLDADGQEVPVLVGASPLEVDGDQLRCLTFTDLSVQKTQERMIAGLNDAQAERLVDLQEAQAALTQQATHDALTGLPNRALLVDRVDQALSRSKRTGQSTAILFVDLDRFKQVNDTRGHAAGDAELRRVAYRLLAVLRPMDTVSRIGGDEFVVLAPDLASELNAVEVGGRLLAALDRHPAGAGGDERIPASIGIAVSVAGRASAEALLAEADAAMYHAKSLGGGRAEVFDEALRRKVRQRDAVGRLLESALAGDRVIVHYQPIVNLSTGAVAGFEALARILDEDGAVLQPGAFIPAAEGSGLIVPLGTRVLELACAQLRAWQQTVPRQPPLTVAVNLSARQFEPGDLPAIVRRQVVLADLDPACLHLELTETAIMDLHPGVVSQLEQLRALGVQIGLDDFGTGYASLTHLRRLPLTFVKIDRSFTQGLESSQQDQRIVAAVIDLAANLDLRSIAEGIETTEQLERLTELGCDQGQGFLFARPLPSEQVRGVGEPSRR
jgi:diguanylate cyclase (GGDEF)-like protein/PAS domain S-box-containing protein